MEFKLVVVVQHNQKFLILRHPSSWGRQAYWHLGGSAWWPLSRRRAGERSPCRRSHSALCWRTASLSSPTAGCPCGGGRRGTRGSRSHAAQGRASWARPCAGGCTPRGPGSGSRWPCAPSSAGWRTPVRAGSGWVTRWRRSRAETRRNRL